MARLKAHGRELLRIEREVTITDPERSTTWEKVTKTYHSDGKILQKHDLRWKPDTYHPHGELYSYGWKLWGNVKKGLNISEAIATVATKIREKGDQANWKIVSGGPAPVIVSESAIMRAIESGEGLGFCKECGHEQDGCEPDARNYKCESCGAMAVYGAEEMLIGA
jgi:hypothetical protein